MAEEIVEELKIQGYNVIDNYSRLRGYGGVLLLANTKYRFEVLKDLKDFSVKDTIEMAGMWDAKNRHLILGIYRPLRDPLTLFWKS